MKKITLVLAVLLAAAPALATINISAVDEGSGVVRIDYDASGHGQLPRAFALDITVSDGNIIDVTDFFVGECNDSNGYGIFPASFARYIDADDPNWADANYTPVAELGDLPSDTQGGIDTNGVTIEMGSLYAVTKGPPESSGTLCKVTVSASCNLTVNGNVGRGEVVNEDTTPATTNLPQIISVTVTAVCTVPDVVGDTNAVAQAAISVDFTIGDITTECSDTIADGNVISTDPAFGAEPGCGTPVDIVVSDGQPTVPDVLDMNETDANAAINAVDYISVGTVTYECNGVEAAGEVLSQSPGAGVAPCGTTVDIVISACLGDVSKPGEPGVPDGQITGDDLGYVNTLLTLYGGRFRVIESADPNYNLCADVSKPGEPGVPDGQITGDDLGYINTRLTLEGGRFRVIDCP